MKINTKMTKEQCKDTGMAMVLILLLLALWREEQSGIFIRVAAITLVLDMIYPPVFKPLAIVWFGFSHILGTVMSKVLLSIVFFGVVTPIGVARKLMGKDSLQLNAFKAARKSVLLVRNHTFVAQDLEKPY